MRVPTRAVLRAELHCLSDDGTVVLTVQRWTDPAAPADRPATWLRLVRNGRRREDREFTGADQHQQLEAFWATLVEEYARTALTEDQMWVKLRDLTGTVQAECASKDCAGRMPVAWPHCPVCRRDSRRVATGSLSGARGRGDIIVPAAAFRRSDIR
jgi:hypothetical protein